MIGSRKAVVPWYRRQRLDEPRSPLKRSGYEAEVALAIKAYNYGGFGTEPRIKDRKFMQHLCNFRNNLEIYDNIIDKKVFSVEEIYIRSLTEGPAFAKFIKKSRSKSLQVTEMIEDPPEEDEHFHSEYSGYDSIIHERYLFFWDETDEVEDWPYSLLEEENFPEAEYRETLETMFYKYKILPYTKDDDIKIIDSTAGKKSSLNTSSGDTTLLKNTWKTDFESGPWLCTRKVVPIHPGNTRDTGVPDVDTLIHLKKIHKHARVISELIPHLANCSNASLQRRFTRIQRGKWFIHIDFKKFGLTANRKLANIALDVIDKGHLKIPDTYLNVEGDIYKTTRGGGALGWCDPLFAIGIAAIIYSFRKRNQLDYMDFIIFNDDVEISINQDIDPERVILLKDALCNELERFDLLLSYRKIYCSRMSVFLEEYHNAQKCEMSKIQLAVQMYSKSLSAKYHWKAKTYYAEGAKYVRSSFLKELCMNSISLEFHEAEFERPIELGGWVKKIDHFTGLNFALEDASTVELSYFYRMGQYKSPHLMPKWVDIPSNDVNRRKDYLIRDAWNVTREKSSLELDPSKKLTEEDKHRILLTTTPPEPEESSDEEPPPLPKRGRPAIDVDPG
jgi:hypothetical protein